MFTIFNSRGNWADCIATHRVALDSARQAGNRQGEAWVLNNLGEALGFTREAEGVSDLERALAIRHEVGDRRGEAQARTTSPTPTQWLGRTDEALDLLRRALELNRDVGYRYGEGVALNNLGEAFLDLPRPRRPLSTSWKPTARSARSTFRMASATPCTSGGRYLSLRPGRGGAELFARGGDQPPGHR